MIYASNIGKRSCTGRNAQLFVATLIITIVIKISWLISTIVCVSELHIILWKNFNEFFKEKLTCKLSVWWRKIKCFYNPPQHQKYLVFIRKLKKSFSMCVILNNVNLWKLWAVCIKSLKNVPNRVVDASLIIQTFDSTIWRPSFKTKGKIYSLYFDDCTFK